MDPAELERVLADNGWRIERAAATLGVSRTSVYRMIESHPTLRTAKDLTLSDIAGAREQTGCDLDAMSELLRVSKAGIRQRIKQLQRE